MQRRLFSLLFSTWLVASFSMAVDGPGREAFPASVIVPVVADSTGAAGEHFQTRISVTNRSAENMTIRVLPFAAGESSCDRPPQLPTAQELTPGATVLLTAADFIEDLAVDGSGFLEILPGAGESIDDLVVRTRLFAETAAGTLGQEVPTVRSSDLIDTAGVTVHLFGLDKGPEGGRSNLGLFIPPSACDQSGQGRLDVEVTTHWKDGLRSSKLTIDAAVGGVTLVNDVFGRGGVAQCRNCRVEVRSDLPIVAWASVIDGGTSDPVLVLGEVR